MNVYIQIEVSALKENNRVQQGKITVDCVREGFSEKVTHFI